MKTMKRIIGTLLTICICFTGVNIQKAQAVDLYKYYEYKKTDKLYNVHKMYKGYEMKYKKFYYNYQVVKLSKNKITLKAQTKWVDSEDPVFGGKKKTYKLASNCKFYYTNVIFPMVGSGDDRVLGSKRISKSVVQKSLHTGEEYDRFFGQVYMKKGKIIAIACNGGD